MGFADPKSFRHFRETGPWPLNGSEAAGNLVLIKTSLLLLCKSSCSNANKLAFKWKSREVCIKARSPPASLASVKWPIVLFDEFISVDLTVSDEHTVERCLLPLYLKVFVRNHSYENMFHLNVCLHSNHTRFCLHEDPF